MKPKIIRVCTVSNSISFVAGMIPDLTKEYDVCVLSSPGEYWNYLERYGNSVKRLEVTMERHISPIRDLKSLFGLIRVFRKEKPTMVHSENPHPHRPNHLCMCHAHSSRRGRSEKRPYQLPYYEETVEGTRPRERTRHRPRPL